VSSSGIKTRRRITTKPAVAAALIVGEGPRDAITEILELQELTVATFDSAEDLASGEELEDHSVIVIWIEDAISSLAGLVETLKQRFAQTPVVIICSSIERWEVRAALAAGAAGVVLYEDLGRALGPCLQAVRAGQTCVPRRHWRQIEPPVLSTREKQILGLVVMGYMNSQIAERLFLAESTVKSHLSSAFGKLGVRSRNEAVSLILDPERGLGMGILALGGEPLEPAVGKAP
jgi:DNA-binding NarL/FixJ family response regulator